MQDFNAPAENQARGGSLSHHNAAVASARCMVFQDQKKQEVHDRSEMIPEVEEVAKDNLGKQEEVPGIEVEKKVVAEKDKKEDDEVEGARSDNKDKSSWKDERTKMEEEERPEMLKRLKAISPSEQNELCSKGNQEEEESEEGDADQKRKKKKGRGRGRGRGKGKGKGKGRGSRKARVASEKEEGGEEATAVEEVEVPRKRLRRCKTKDVPVMPELEEVPKENQQNSKMTRSKESPKKKEKTTEVAKKEMKTERKKRTKKVEGDKEDVVDERSTERKPARKRKGQQEDEEACTKKGKRPRKANAVKEEATGKTKHVDEEKLAERKAKVSRKSSAYHVAKREAIAEGCTHEEAVKRAKLVHAPKTFQLGLEQLNSYRLITLFIYLYIPQKMFSIT